MDFALTNFKGEGLPYVFLKVAYIGLWGTYGLIIGPAHLLKKPTLGAEIVIFSSWNLTKAQSYRN